jgi:hypothetical protein
MMMPNTKERPIIFSAESVRAILEGRKTQTRRVVRPQPNDQPRYVADVAAEEGWYVPHSFGDIKIYDPLKCPHGRPGDFLWVREKFRLTDFSFIDDDWNASVQYADLSLGVRKHYLERGGDEKTGWRSPTHMPRWASRIALEIKDVRVERLQSMRNEDFLREGIRSEACNICVHYGGSGCEHCGTLYRPFLELWDKLNKKRGCGWNMNPWVFVVSFKAIKNA